MDLYARWLGFLLMYVGGALLLALVLYGLLVAVLSVPLFKPKVLKILELGSKQWLADRRQR